MAQIAHLLLPVAIVDLVLDARAQLAAVGRVALPGLGGEDVAVLEGELVGGRQHRLVEEDVLDAHVQAVARADVFGLGVGVAVEEDLGADVVQGLLDLAAAGKDGIERLNVGVDSGGKGRVGGRVLGRVLEEVLAAQGAEGRGPAGAGVGSGSSSRSHGGRGVDERDQWGQAAGMAVGAAAAMASGWVRVVVVQRGLAAREKKKLHVCGVDGARAWAAAR